MRKTVFLAALALLLFPAALPARADCAYELEHAKAQLRTVTDRGRAAAVKKYLDRAAEEQPVAEVACRNDVTRAWRLLKAPPDDQAERDPNKPLYGEPINNGRPRPATGARTQ